MSPITELRKVRWFRHPSAASINKAFLKMVAREAGVRAKDFEQDPSALEDITDMGGWGFCIPAKREVHYWFSPMLPMSERVRILGHELGHLLEEKANIKTIIRGAPRDEMRADLYGELARVAYAEAILLRSRGGKP